MDTNERLRIFMQNVQRIRAPYGDLTQNGIPGHGQANMGAESVEALYRATATFARVYQTPAFNAETVSDQADAVEQAINLAASTGALPTEQADQLVDNLLELVAKRGSR